MNSVKIAIFFVVLSLFLVSCEVAGSSSREEHIELPKQLTLPPKGNSKPKIIAFGDSLTAGFGLSEKESYPYLLQKRIEKDGFDFEVINAGVSGDTTLGGLERIDWVLGQENIEILILELGANDLMRGVPVADMRKNLEKIILKAKKAGVRVLFCGMFAPPNRGEEYRRGSLKLFPDLANKYDLEFLPFLLENVALEKELNQPDGIHPNAKGAIIMTDNVYRELKPMLGKSKE